MSPKGARRVWALIGVAFGWVTVAFFGLAPASALVSFLAAAVGRPELVKATAFTATTEALVYFVLAAAVFRVARLLGLPRWYWVVGPLGYLVSFGAFLGVMLLESTMALPQGAGWTFLVADLIATGLGAWLASRGTPPGTSAVADPSPERAHEEPA